MDRMNCLWIFELKNRINMIQIWWMLSRYLFKYWFCYNCVRVHMCVYCSNFLCRFCRLNLFLDGNVGNFKWNFKITFWSENSLVKKDIKISATYLKCIFGWVTWDSSSQRFCDTKKVCWGKSTSCWERK